MKQKAFTMKERQILEERWEKGDGAAEIAVDMGFSPAAVYQELKRGEVRDEATGELMLDANQRKKYSAEQGQAVYYANLRNRGRRPAAAQ